MIQEQITEAVTIPAKHIYVDVVGFTRDRSVEAQSDIVHTLNGIVSASMMEHGVPKDKVIFLPTGDGLCIVLLNVESPYDIHMQLALSLIRKVVNHSKNVGDPQRAFEVRIGINSNTDNLVTDVNGSQNIAGAGINIAARVMSKADGNQIMVGQNVYETLRYREKYMDKFEGYPAEVKHGTRLNVYMYADTEACEGLNTETPSAFIKPEKQPSVEPKINVYAAHYLAHAIKNRQFLLDNKEVHRRFAVVVLLGFMALDSLKRAEASETDVVSLDTYKADEATLKEQLDYYYSLGSAVTSQLEDHFRNMIGAEGHRCFERGYIDTRFVTPEGVAKLKNDHPDVWDSFKLDLFVS